MRVRVSVVGVRALPIVNAISLDVGKANAVGLTVADTDVGEPGSEYVIGYVCTPVEDVVYVEITILR